jgi:hypothetical protein
MTQSPDSDTPPLFQQSQLDWLVRQLGRSQSLPPETDAPTGRHSVIPDEEPLDLVNHPAHYKSPNPKYNFEAIQVIEGWNLHKEHGLATALAYILRALYKGTPSQDARKAAWYLIWWADLYDEENPPI